MLTKLRNLKIKISYKMWLKQQKFFQAIGKQVILFLMKDPKTKEYLRKKYVRPRKDITPESEIQSDIQKRKDS